MDDFPWVLGAVSAIMTKRMTPEAATTGLQISHARKRLSADEILIVGVGPSANSTRRGLGRSRAVVF